MPRTIFTTITPLPAGVSRETGLATLHDHLEMIDLNPAHTSRRMIPPPPEANPEEYHCTWYEIVDKISYFPGYSGEVSFKACFHDLPLGTQIHVYAPMGLDIKEKWTLAGNEPHEPVQPVELGIGAPISGLYLREDVEIKCNFLVTRFVRKQLKEALATLVARLLVKTQLQEAAEKNRRLTQSMNPSYSAQNSPPNSPRPTHAPSMLRPPVRYSQMSQVSQQSQHSQYSPHLTTPPISPPAPVTPPLSGSFPKHAYDPSAYAHLQQKQYPQHPQVLCPPQWSPQTSQLSYKNGQQQYYPEYDDKPMPVYNEMDANQTQKLKPPQPPVELPASLH
ncbi:hypothetical protein HYALB_00001534 [Hymenoscyphus albidus]|uniref:DUF7053 domain-containing protein n=1 Tax=Hymenoscyphus albidus TaxID=595503 RepID=A0A9N9LE96_9HELO|nr:hypothetical protein HYALB_00001534 [Hymenoscyphus albidus]